MQIDLRTVSIKPLRNTFDHLARRFGDKPASRYQEGTYDLQATENLQYRPTWDPQHQLHDAARTAVVMKDWYALKDPRQYYYGTYTIARARQQEAAEASFEFFESRGLDATLDPALKRTLLDLLIPLRHAAWGANMNNTGMCADGYGTAITQPCMYQAMDNLGVAQYLTRIALTLADADELDAAKAAWLDTPRWQGIRRLVEEMLVTRDWFELYVAQNLVFDGLLYTTVYEQLVDKQFTARGGASIAMLTAFIADWFVETSKWVDAVIKTAAQESPANKTLIAGWAAKWKPRVHQAIVPIAEHAIGDEAGALLAGIVANFDARLAKLGLAE